MILTVSLKVEPRPVANGHMRSRRKAMRNKLTFTLSVTYSHTCRSLKTNLVLVDVDINTSFIDKLIIDSELTWKTKSNL